jgi:hypothetical protein
MTFVVRDTVLPGAPESVASLREMLASLEAQVGVLLEERDELQLRLARADAEVVAIRRRARALVTAVLDETLV